MNGACIDKKDKKKEKKDSKEDYQEVGNVFVVVVKRSKWCLY